MIWSTSPRDEYLIIYVIYRFDTEAEHKTPTKVRVHDYVKSRLVLISVARTTCEICENRHVCRCVAKLMQ